MTLYINIGRRVPRSWVKRTAVRAKGMMSFQENIWMMIKNSLDLAKRKANASGKIIFVMEKDIEYEDLNFQLEWLKITIQGTKEQELEELDDTNKLYEPFGKVFKNKMTIEKDDNLKKCFKTKVLTTAKVDEAYKNGYGAMNSNNISNKLLEMGILTHVKLVEDYDNRDVVLTKKG